MKKKREITEKTRVSRVKSFIGRDKFFQGKHHKNTVCYWAAFDSWAARGQAGGCNSCHTGHYNVVIINKRMWNKNLLLGTRKHGCKIAEVCQDCFYEIQKQINYKIPHR